MTLKKIKAPKLFLSATLFIVSSLLFSAACSPKPAANTSAVNTSAANSSEPNPADVLKKMLDIMSKLKVVSFDVRGFDGYTFGKSENSVNAVSQITLRTDPYSFYGKLVGDDGKIYEVISGDKKEFRASLGGEVSKADLTQGVTPNNVFGDIRVVWENFISPDVLQKAVASNKLIYAGREDVQGDMCDIIVYVQSDSDKGIINTNYYWISTTTSLPRAVQNFMFTDGKSFAVPRRQISNLKINPEADNALFTYTPTAAETAKFPAGKVEKEKPEDSESDKTAVKNFRDKIVNNPLPDADVVDLNYKPGKLSSYKTKGMTTLVTFWATWCGPCVEEMPLFKKMVDKYPNKFQVLAVATFETMNSSAEYAKNHSDYPFTFLLDPDWQMENSKLAQNFGVKGLPTNLLIDADGKVIDYWLGDLKEEELTKKIENALPKS